METLFFSKTESFREPDAVVVLKREASAQRTQADHLRQKSLRSSSSREPRVPGKPDAMFSFDSELTPNTFLARNRGNEPGDQFESGVRSVLDLLTRQIL